MKSTRLDDVRARLSTDTTRDIEDRQVAHWRQMSSVDIARTINSAWAAARKLAWFSLKEQFPAASDQELRTRLAVLTLGRELASRAYPEVNALFDR